MQELQLETVYLLDLGSITALDFMHKYPEKVDALILVSTEISPYHSLEEAMDNLPHTLQRYIPMSEAIREGDLAHATDEAMNLLAALSFVSSESYQLVRI